ncbi:hypothetical protein GJAV_G00241550 [Gymnothorax javanicus]|nr:hypothetical protein GJAV_G00241550 [Gymnothorax javanicus]
MRSCVNATEKVKYILGRSISSVAGRVLLNILFLALSAEVWFLLSLLCVLALATLGFLKQSPRRTEIKQALQEKSPSGESWEGPQHCHSVPPELVLRDLLRELDEVLSQARPWAECARSLLHWDSYRDSAVFYGSLLLVLCLLYSVPLCYTLVVINSALLLWNGELHKGVRDVMFRRPKTSEEHDDREQDSASLCNAVLSWKCLDASDELDADYDFKDAIEDGDEDEDDDDDCGIPLIVRRGALVGAIPVFHLKGQTRGKRRKLYSRSNSGNCSRCQASFSMLKKKRSCSNCGSSFCARCCFKVLKSSLHSADPEDQKERVFVCTLCSVSLRKQE